MLVTAYAEECYGPMPSDGSVLRPRTSVNDSNAYITSRRVLHEPRTPTNMTDVYTVYAKESPSRRGLGVGLALAGLAGSLALGAGVARLKDDRTDHALGERIHPQNWPISFRLPDNLAPVTPARLGPSSDDLVYADRAGPFIGETIVIARRNLGRVRPPTWIAERYPLPMTSLLPRISEPRALPPSPLEFGPLPGAEVRCRIGRETIVTRYGLCPDGAAVSVTLLGPNSAARRARHLLDAIVGSVELTRETFAPAGASLPFSLPHAARVATVSGDASLSRLRHQIFSAPSDRGFWHIDLYEVHLADGRAPADLLFDTARIHLQATQPLEAARESSPGSWRMSGPSRSEDGVRYEYRLLETESRRVLIAVGTSLDASHSELGSALDTILSSHEHTPTSRGSAAASASSILEAVPLELERRRSEGTTETWSLLFHHGALEGYVHESVGPAATGESLESHQIYVRHASDATLSGRSDAVFAVDLQSHELDGLSRDSLTDGRTFARNWKERRAPGEDVNRLTVLGQSRTSGTFAAPANFLPAPAIDAAALLVARRGQPVCFLTTSANLAVGPIGVRMQPIETSALDWSHLPESSPPPPVRLAVRVDHDCGPESDILAFDDRGRVVAQWIGKDVVLVEGSAAEALQAFPTAPQFIAAPGSQR